MQQKYDPSFSNAAGQRVGRDGRVIPDPVSTSHTEVPDFLKNPASPRHTDVPDFLKNPAHPRHGMSVPAVDGGANVATSASKSRPAAVPSSHVPQASAKAEVPTPPSTPALQPAPAASPAPKPRPTAAPASQPTPAPAYYARDEWQPPVKAAKKKRNPLVSLKAHFGSGFSFAPIVIGVVAVALIVVMVFFPPFFKVSVNGTEYTVNAGTTVKDVVEKGYASPAAGNLLAVDGSVITQGGGTAFTATVDDAAAEADTRLSRGNNVQVSDGADVTEDYTETTEVVPAGTSASETTFNNYYNGSIHTYSAGEDGEKVVRTGSVSGISVEEVTKQAVDAGYHHYNINTGDDKVIALTFDDGPWAETTGEILDVLKEYNAKATFFEVGTCVENHPELTQRVYAEGHQIGTHTYDHAAGGSSNISVMSAEEQREEVSNGFAAIENALGTSINHIMRAPGGNYYGDAVSNLSDLVTAEIGWNIDTRDWARPGAEAIAEKICSALPGDVVLMHDGGGDRSQTVEALKIALPKLVEEGYSFITIDELMTYGMPEGA